MTLRIAHLSDPHFSCITFNPSQFLTKRWMGNLNLILFRRKAYQTTHLGYLPKLMENLDIDTVILSGDFTSTSMHKEFEKARDFVDEFKQPTFTLPGNHDCYTKKSDRLKRYYTYFPSEELEKRRVEKKPIGKGWWWVGLDCARPNNLLNSNGVFYREMDAILEKTLQSIPEGDKVIIGNHFPLFPSGRPHHDTGRATELGEILKKHPQVKLYLHGHDHYPYIIDRRNEGFPLVLNCGSCAHQPDGTFYTIELTGDECVVERLLFTEEQGRFAWVIDLQKHYTFK